MIQRNGKEVQVVPAATPTTFAIPHGLPVEPLSISVIPCTLDAVGVDGSGTGVLQSPFYSADATNIYVTYIIAPAVGLQLGWYWSAVCN